MKDLVTVFTPVYNRKNLIGNLYPKIRNYHPIHD